ASDPVPPLAIDLRRSSCWKLAKVEPLMPLATPGRPLICGLLLKISRARRLVGAVGVRTLFRLAAESETGWSVPLTEIDADRHNPRTPPPSPTEIVLADGTCATT